MFSTPATRKLLVAGWAALCLLLAGGDQSSRLLGQPGIRAREKVVTRSRANRRRPPRRKAVSREPPAPVSLWVVTDPPGCSVFVEGEDQGKTDGSGELELRLLPGSYYVRVSRDGYVSREADIEVEDSADEQEVEFKLPLALTSLNISTDPPEAEVYLDDVYKGASNVKGLLIIERVNPAAPHTLRVSKEGYQTQTFPLTTYTGQIPVKLLPSAVRLKVLTDPPETEVYLNDVYKGTSTADGVLVLEQVNPNQTHSLRAAKAGFRQQTVPVPPNTPEVSVRLPPEPLVLLVKDLKQHISQGRLAEAFRDYERLASDAPDHPELPRFEESILQGLQARSTAALRRVGPYGLAADAQEVQVLNSLYEQARRLRPGDEKIDEFGRYWGLKHLMTRAELSSTTAEREALRQRVRSALSEFGGRNPGNMNLLLDLGWVWWKLSDRARAQKNFAAALELKPDWAYAHFAIGTLSMSEAEGEVSKAAKAAKYGQAISSFTRAIETKHDFARAYALRSISYAVLNRHEESVASGLQAVALEPQSAYAHFALGYAYFQKGKPGYRNALGAFERALSLGGGELDDATKAAIQQRLGVIRKTLR